MSAEIELKLEMSPDSLARLRRSPAIARYRIGRAITRHLSNVYYDTPDLSLSKEGIALRVRTIGRQHLQTVKTSGSSKGAHFERGEWEIAIPEPRPHASALVDTPLAARFPDAAALMVLKPCVQTTFKRTTWVLADTDWEIEVSLDDGTVTGGQHSALLCEAELELRRGHPHHLFSLARQLADGITLHIGRRSKAEKGFDLLAGRDIKPSKGGTPPLKRTMPCVRAIRLIADDCLRQLVSNTACFNATCAPEAVHQMRVSMRRLRSAMAIFKPILKGARTAHLKTELKWATTALGEARDLDVFLADIVSPVRAAFPDNGGLIALESEITSRRENAYTKALNAVDSPRFSALVLDLAGWLENGDWQSPDNASARDALKQPVGTFAAKSLMMRARTVMRRGRNFADLDAERRHDVRIEVKKLRYTVDFFSNLWPKKTVKPFARALRAAQESLGTLNDIAVAHALLKDWTQSPVGQDRDKMRGRAFAAGLVAGWHEHSAAGQLSRATVAWKDFSKAVPFWRD